MENSIRGGPSSPLSVFIKSEFISVTEYHLLSSDMFLASVFLNELVFFFHLLPQTLPKSCVDRLAEFKFTTYIKWIRIVLNIVATSLAATEYYASAGIVFGASALFWLFLYLWIAEEWDVVVTETDLSEIDSAFLAVHVGAVNFVVDVPGMGCKSARGSHFVIQLSNVVALVALAIGLSVSEPLEKAWGCYPEGAPLTSGMCASHYNVCIPPKVCPWLEAPACELTNSLRNCGIDALSGQIRETFSPFRSVGLSALFFSASVYLLSYGDKTKDVTVKDAQPNSK